MSARIEMFRLIRFYSSKTAKPQIPLSQSDVFQDQLPENSAFADDQASNFSTSFQGVSSLAFAKEITDVLTAPIDPKDIEIKPDGLIYLPEIKYRRILIKAFGVGGWGLVPRGPHTVNGKNISREFALFCHGRFISQARGEQDYFGSDNLPTASEGCKSNALMRNCKDLGIASELWDPVFIREFKQKYCALVSAVHVPSNTKKFVWKRQGRTLDYPFREEKK